MLLPAILHARGNLPYGGQHKHSVGAVLLFPSQNDWDAVRPVVEVGCQNDNSALAIVKRALLLIVIANPLMDVTIVSYGIPRPVTIWLVPILLLIFDNVISVCESVIVAPLTWTSGADLQTPPLFILKFVFETRELEHEHSTSVCLKPS